MGRAPDPGRSRKKLGLGKIPIDVLNEKVLRMTGMRSMDVVTPPKAGLDFAAIKLGKGFMIVSADPITGVTKGIGEYAMKVSANDVATSGNRPQFAESVILLPEGSTDFDAGLIAGQMDQAARDLGIAIVGGHTEVTQGIKRPIVAITVFSFAQNYVSSDNAQEGDSIIMTKTAGLEGTAILAEDAARLRSPIPSGTLRRARSFLGQISIVDEATVAYRTGAVHAMHDCTEGGVLGAVFEMSLASGLGFLLKEKAVAVAPETEAICRNASVDPLKLIGSGSLILAVEPGKEHKVLDALKPVCRANTIGRFQAGRRVMIAFDGTEHLIRKAPEDELWRVLARSRRGRQGP